jgi:hypothetical protein
MSAKNAAAALVKFDVDAAVLLPASGELLSFEGALSLGGALRTLETLRLVAAAAGVTEQQVVAAVFRHHTLCGSALVCQGYAANVFQK